MRCIEIGNYSKGHLIEIGVKSQTAEKFPVVTMFNEYLLRNYHVDSSGTEDTEMNKTKSQTLLAYFHSERKTNAYVCIGEIQLKA